MKEVKTVAVAAAWLRDNKNRILLCRRNEHKTQGGLGELPGERFF